MRKWKWTPEKQMKQYKQISVWEYLAEYMIALIILAIPMKYLWNIAMPGIGLVEITYVQSLCLLIMIRIMIGLNL